MRTLLQEVLDVRGIAGQCPTLTFARWYWQVDVPYTIGGNNIGQRPIRCKGGFFEDKVVEMDKPCLWIVDCKRGGTGDNDAPWTNVEY